MSKRAITEDETSSSKMAREYNDVDEDERHNVRMVAWESVQNFVDDTMAAMYGGMISTVDAYKSYNEHKLDLQKQGYAFGTYNTDRSLFEKLDRLVFKDNRSTMGSTVFKEAKNILKQINIGSKPKKSSFSMLVMMSTEYITPVANMVLLLSHPSATKEDLDLFWELTDRLWCFAHPVYCLHSGYLDETCDKITKRLQALAPRVAAEATFENGMGEANGHAHCVCKAED